MAEKALTIIVATYQRPEWLARSLRSILLAASCGEVAGIDTRVIVADDASPGPETRAVADDAGVDYLCNPHNDGRQDPSQVRHLALQSVDTPYYCFFDDDDVMLPFFVTLHVEMIERRQLDVCHSGYWFTDAELRPTRRLDPSPAHLGDALANHNMVNDHAVVRTDVSESVWRPELGMLMPYGGWLELLALGRRFDRLRVPTYLYRRHAGNMSATHTASAEIEQARGELLVEYRDRVRRERGRVPPPRMAHRVRSAIPDVVREVLAGRVTSSAP